MYEEAIVDRLLRKAEILDRELASTRSLIDSREKQLIEAALGFEAAVLLPLEEGTHRNSCGDLQPADWRTTFGFGMRAGKLGFFVQRSMWVGTRRDRCGRLGEEELLEEREPKDLRQASPKVCIEAMAAYGRLLKALDQVADDLLNKASIGSNQTDDGSMTHIFRRASAMEEREAGSGGVLPQGRFAVR